MYVFRLLDEINTAGGPLAEDRVLDISAMISGTIATLHDVHGMLLNDLKPGAIFL